MKKMDTAIEWKISEGLIPYPEAVDAMEQRVSQIRAGEASPMVWLLEHPPLYTAGTSAKSMDLLDNQRFPIYQSGRGGQFTYHGPGQRIAYVMLDLKKSMPEGPDIRFYVQLLERWLIQALAQFGLKGHIREGRIGVWVENGNSQEAKIAAIGIRIRKWVTYHGISLNVAPDLSHYAGIIPCGIANYGVTSFEKLGIHASMAEVDAVLKEKFGKIFLG